MLILKTVDIALPFHLGNHIRGNRSDGGQSQATIFGTYNSSRCASYCAGVP